MASDQHFSFNFFPQNVFVSKIFPKSSGLFWPPCDELNQKLMIDNVKIIKQDITFIPKVPANYRWVILKLYNHCIKARNYENVELDTLEVGVGGYKDVACKVNQ